MVKTSSLICITQCGMKILSSFLKNYKVHVGDGKALSQPGDPVWADLCDCTCHMLMKLAWQRETIQRLKRIQSLSGNLDISL